MKNRRMNDPKDTQRRLSKGYKGGKQVERHPGLCDVPDTRTVKEAIKSPSA